MTTPVHVLNALESQSLPGVNIVQLNYRRCAQNGPLAYSYSKEKRSEDNIIRILMRSEILKNIADGV